VALVVFLRGLNVGGHRRVRPARLAAALERFGAVNVGAAGTLVLRRPAGQRVVRRELDRRLPVPTEIMVCDGAEVRALLERPWFAGRRSRPDRVRFVSILARQPRMKPRLPLQVPERGPWVVRVLAREGRYVVGVYRRQMRAIGCLGELDRLFGVPATTRSWSTLAAVGAVLDQPPAPRRPGTRRPRP
jgi:uncharacterized protein (DUF1697 family)